MSYFKLMAFKMGRHKDICQECTPKCEFRVGTKCKLYTCQECGEFIEEGTPVVRVIFQATHKMESRRRYLHGRGIDREPKEAQSFVTFHIDCYKRQLDRWIDTQLERRKEIASI